MLLILLFIFQVYGDSDTILASTQKGVRISSSLFSQVWSDLDTIFNDLQDDDSLQDVNTTVSFGDLLDEKFQTLVQDNTNYTANIDIVSAIYKTYKQVIFQTFQIPIYTLYKKIFF